MLTLSRFQAVFSIIPYVLWAAFSALRTFAISRQKLLSIIIFVLSLSAFVCNVVRQPVFLCYNLLHSHETVLTQYRIAMLQVVNIPPFGWMQGIDISESGVKLSVPCLPFQREGHADSHSRCEIKICRCCKTVNADDQVSAY